MRWYRRFLVALPADVRHRDGRAMVALFEDLAREAVAVRTGTLFMVWLRSVLDVASLGTRERLRMRRGTMAGSSERWTMDSVLLDLRHGLRALIRRPGFAAIACATFALGIGSTTAIFGVVDAVLLRELPYDAPERVVRLLGTREGVPNVGGTLAYENARDVGEASTSFESLAAYDEWRPNVTGLGEAELVPAALVNASFFRVLGVRPAAGRFFVDEEDVDGRDRVVVLHWKYWQSRFGGDASVIGRTIELNGNPHTIVGIAPRDFEDPALSGGSWGEPMIWRPLGYEGLPESEQPSRGSSSYVAIARLSEGVPLARASAELATLSFRLREQYPEQNEEVGMIAVPIREAIVGDVRGTLVLLLGAVSVLLAIAAANVGNLLLGHAAERRREVALRVALGASRGRVMRQIVTETVVLAIVGGIGGVVLALTATGALVSLGSEFIPRSGGISVDASVVLFAFVVTLATGVVCGLVPAMSASSTDLRGSLGESRGATGGRASLRFRRGLIASEVALALLLLVGAGLLAKSLWRLMRVDVGIDPAHVLSFQLSPSSASYPDDDAVDAVYDRLFARLAALPDVREVGAINIAPLTGGFDGNRIRPEEGPYALPDARFSAQVRTVTPGYFPAVDLALRRGRLLEERDRADQPPVAVVSEAFARAVWPGEDPLGRRFSAAGTTVETVGVVDDVKHLKLEEPAPPMVYVARAQRVIPWQVRRTTVVLRTRGEASAVIPSVRAQVRAIDDRLPLASMQTMEQVIAASATPPRFRTLLLGTFSVLALVLATLGIYGVVSYSVAQRSREMAIRMALGAKARELLGMVVRQGLAPVLAGTAVGLTAALALSRVLAAVLFEVTTIDTMVFAGVPALMILVATAASVVPAMRATRVSPMEAIREQ